MVRSNERRGDSGETRRRPGLWIGPAVVELLVVALLTAVGLHAQEPEVGEPADDTGDVRYFEPEDAGEGAGPDLRFGFEGKAHFRDSDLNRFPVPFPFTPDMLPPGVEQGFMETVNEGSHLEISVLTLRAEARWSDVLEARAKIDFIDLYDRNPTSEDDEFDVDELWVRFGREVEPALEAERSGVYLKVGKFPKFERQDDRHLESYGLVTTAFNRMEDVGVELGAHLGSHLYLKAQATQGNPVFLRDPNALAGDNGIGELRQSNPDPELKTGITIPYDADVEDVDVDGDLELGGGLGLRFSNLGGSRGVDLLVWGYRRDLAETVDFKGTFYGGDLDLLRGPLNAFPFPITGDEKEEVGGNLWLYLDGFSLFAQWVDQDLAGLERTGLEAEAAWRFDLPLKFAVGGRQLFPWIAPAVRFSRLDPDFAAPPITPSPSFAWEWEKVDAGIRLAILDGIDLTVEYAANDFVLGSGAERGNDEFLTTLRWRVGRAR